jgi:hypothetical protein
MQARDQFHRRLQKLTQLWKDYRDMVTAAHGAEKTTPADENRFLGLKADIAARLQTLRQDVPPAVATETAREVAAMTEMLGGHRSLARGDPAHGDDLDAFTEQWHRKYIFLSRLAGADFEERKGAAPRAPATAVPTGFEKAWLPRRRVPVRLVRYLVGLAVLAAAVFIVGWGLGVERDAEGRMILEPPSSFGAALGNVGDGLETAWSRIAGMLGPVIEVYGQTWTMILVGMLFLSLAYWIFLRG